MQLFKNRKKLPYDLYMFICFYQIYFQVIFRRSVVMTHSLSRTYQQVTAMKSRTCFAAIVYVAVIFCVFYTDFYDYLRASGKIINEVSTDNANVLLLSVTITPCARPHISRKPENSECLLAAIFLINRYSLHNFN